jgi:hypothetical protein
MIKVKTLPASVTQHKSLLLRNTTGLERLISIWELMPAPGPGDGNSVALTMEPPRCFRTFALIAPRGAKMRRRFAKMPLGCHPAA